MKWDENDDTKKDGAYDFDKLAETIRFECPCGEVFKDKPADRRTFVFSGKYVPLNTNAAKNRRSYHWNALLPPWVKWRDLVEEFLFIVGDVNIKVHSKKGSKPLNFRGRVVQD